MILYQKNGIVVDREAGLRRLFLNGQCQGRAEESRVPRPFSQYMVDIVGYIMARDILHILVIGGGACLIPSALKGRHVSIVEPNEEMLDVARQFFRFDPAKYTIYNMEAQKIDPSYKWDCIVLDAYDGSKHIPELYDKEARIKWLSMLNPNGVLITNDISTGSNVLQFFHKE